MNYEMHSQDAHLELIRRIRRICQLLSQLCTDYEKNHDPTTLASIRQRITELTDTGGTLDISYQEETR